MSLGTAVIVPGFLGSQLAYASGPSAGNDAFLSTYDLLATRGGSLQLAADGKSPGPLATAPLVATGPVDAGLYEPLITALANAGYLVDFYAYDWRLDITTSAAALAAYIAALTQGGNVYVVCHSMGGLVAQLAYPIWKALGKGPTWVRSVYLGVPSGGTAYAALGLCGYRYNQFMLNILSNQIGLSLLGVQLSQTAQGLLLARWNQVVASWPALYQLLPSDVGQWNGLDPNAVQYQNLANYTRYNSSVSQSWLSTGIATQTALAEARGGLLPAETVVIALGQSTPDKISDPSQFGALAGYTMTVKGDGVVTQSRATLTAIPVVTLTGDHQSYCAGSVPRAAAWYPRSRATAARRSPSAGNANRAAAASH